MIKQHKEVGNFSIPVITELKAFCFPWQKAKIFNQNLYRRLLPAYVEEFQEHVADVGPYSALLWQ